MSPVDGEKIAVVRMTVVCASLPSVHPQTNAATTSAATCEPSVAR
jgi:hypothetical protein